MKYNFTLALLVSAGIISGCTTIVNKSTTETNSCNIPSFNQQTAEKQLVKWGNGLKLYSVSSNPDKYLGAGYFAMTYYAPDAILQPTVSQTQRSGTQELYDYFTHFVTTNPIMSIPSVESNAATTLGCGYGSYAGNYDFTKYSGTAKEQSVSARFTFIYKYMETSFTTSFTVESGPQKGKVITQTNQPGWYVYKQQSSILPVDN